MNCYEVTIEGKTFSSYTTLCNHLGVQYSNESKKARRKGVNILTHLKQEYGPVIRKEIEAEKAIRRFLYGHQR